MFMETLLAFVRDNIEIATPLLLACGVFVLLFLLVLVIIVWRFFSGMSTYRNIMEQFGASETAEELSRLLVQLDELDERMAHREKHDAEQDHRLEAHSSHLQEVVQRVGLVRYNAFPDVAGDQSYSLAMLNALGDGVVLTTLHGRAEARTYAKKVVHGASNYPLLPEEQQAIFQALHVATAIKDKPRTPAKAATVTTPEVTLQERAYLLGRAEEMRSFSQENHGAVNQVAEVAPTPAPTSRTASTVAAISESASAPETVVLRASALERTSTPASLASSESQPQIAWGEYTRVVQNEATQTTRSERVRAARAALAQEEEVKPASSLPELEALVTSDPIPLEEALPTEEESEAGWPVDDDTPPPWMSGEISEAAGLKKISPRRARDPAARTRSAPQGAPSDLPEEGSAPSDAESKTKG